MSLVKLCGIKNLSDVFVCLKEKDEDNGVLFFDKINNMNTRDSRTLSFEKDSVTWFIKVEESLLKELNEILEAFNNDKLVRYDNILSREKGICFNFNNLTVNTTSNFVQIISDKNVVFHISKDEENVLERFLTFILR